ncbi:B-cadherin-like isoform 3-T3 [Menidia menidia]
MGTASFAVLGVLLVVFQPLALDAVEEPVCVPGFGADLLIFRVTSNHLRQGRRLGKVDFTDCTGRKRFLFNTDDSRFVVHTDGTLTVKRQVVLHEGKREFFLHSWDSQGHKMTVPVMVVHHGHHHGNHHRGAERHHEHHHEHHSPQHHLSGMESINATESATDEAVSVIYFPKSAEGQRRRKRCWVIPEISVSENERIPYPRKISQIRSGEDKTRKIYYSITGPGADQPPVNLFTMDKSTGVLYVTQPLDREKQDVYTFKAHAVAEGSGSIEEPMDVIVKVIDQNDNAPFFEESSYRGKLAESSPVGHEVIQVVATDLDEPGNYNSLIRYSILSQEPKEPDQQMFVINAVTGMIRLSAQGLDRERLPQYTLEVQAADFEGNGLSGKTKVIINVTDSSDNAPAFSQPSSATDEAVPVIYFPKSAEGQRRRKRGWVIPEISVSENERKEFPLKISQIRSDEDKSRKIYYSITGPGADQPPVNLFTMDKSTGVLYVTQPLDREKQDVYTFKAHAVAEGSGSIEEPMDVIVKVIDQNDNAPIFEESSYRGQLAESSPVGHEVIQVVATDLDEPGNYNSLIRYSILSQEPKEPNQQMFVINAVTGMIRLNAQGLDREKISQYTLEVQAADSEGKGLSGKAKVIIEVTDSNDNAPAFSQPSYTGTVEENKADAVAARLLVTDKDDAHTPAWNAKFKIVGGDPKNLFTVETGTNKQEGILKTAQGLDFETSSIHILLVAVENDVPFAIPLPTATATVTVTVKDVNEPPVFDPPTKNLAKKEDYKGPDLVVYTASDPDTARKQKVMYKIIRDPAGWLNVDETNGKITLKSQMDRESSFVKDDNYMALIGAYDDDEIPATGTGTLIIKLEDVNDNGPTIDEREVTMCRKNPVPQLLSVSDKDGPGNAAPYSVVLHPQSATNWTARMNDNKTAVILALANDLESGVYNVVLKVLDNGGNPQDSTVKATVCECSGADVSCNDLRGAAVSNLPAILGVLGGVLLLLMLLLLLLLFVRNRRGEKQEPLLPEEDIRDNIYYYDEEGGGEDDQDFDLGVLHRGLDNRPEVFRNDVVPNFMPAPQYRPRPANPDDIGKFIEDNLNAADSDPTAPPYDSLLVFDYEGGGSDAGSLSSLNSSSSGDQNYDCLQEWGPRFKKLADMYGGGEDDDML